MRVVEFILAMIGGAAVLCFAWFLAAIGITCWSERRERNRIYRAQLRRMVNPGWTDQDAEDLSNYRASIIGEIRDEM